MNIKIMEKEEMKLVGIPWNGTYSQVDSIPQLFNEFENRLEEVPNQTTNSILIAPFHGRETEFTYYVTTPVEKFATVPEGMIAFTIPRKYYVYTTHKGRMEDVEHTYQEMVSWMNDYGYDLDDSALGLEIFNNEHKHLIDQGDLYFELYLPVKTYK